MRLAFAALATSVIGIAPATGDVVFDPRETMKIFSNAVAEDGLSVAYDERECVPFICRGTVTYAGEGSFEVSSTVGGRLQLKTDFSADPAIYFAACVRALRALHGAMSVGNAQYLMERNFQKAAASGSSSDIFGDIKLEIDRGDSLPRCTLVRLRHRSE